MVSQPPLLHESHLVLALIPLFPFVGFLINAFFGRRLSKAASGGIACLAMIASFGASVGAALAALPAVWVMIGVAAALAGAFPRFAPFSWGVLLVTFLATEIGPMTDLPSWLLDLSPFTHLSPLPGGAFETVSAAVLTLLAAALVVKEHQELVFISQNGIVQRTGVRGINRYGRTSQGVRVMKLREGDEVSAVALVVESDAPAAAPTRTVPSPMTASAQCASGARSPEHPSEPCSRTTGVMPALRSAAYA